MPYLLDSDVLIDISRNALAAIVYVDALPAPWMISQVSAMELLVGARGKREVAHLDAFVSAYPTVPLSDSVGRRAYRLLMQYAKSHGLHVFDSLVAATALEHGLTLVTRNQRQFAMIDGLILQVPKYQSL
jgi:predicted nucleic acid-binding protein